ncbi:hypothetical protein [Terribacillus sp. AE2B 122]|uniref:hypothetical protein n=1 Tax=Terribacillus sp. AE2B 122 TaxID=1331902 RepID=UPI0015830DC1|nr:hypothetical protein [Terribacillus sp. AE2B 122]
MLQNILTSKKIYLGFIIAFGISLFLVSSPVSAATYASTDKAVYPKGENIVITGTSDTYPPGSQYKVEIVKGDPLFGEYITESYVYLDANGDFNTTIKTSSAWDAGDDYIAKFYFGPTGSLLNVSNTFTVK